MALKKSLEVFGFPTTNYVKPVSIVIEEDKTIEGVKFYKVQMIVVFFTNETQQHKYAGKQFTFEDLTEQELTLPNFYGLLMQHPEFEGYEQA